jgi:hypothetical protein
MSLLGPADQGRPAFPAMILVRRPGGGSMPRPAKDLAGASAFRHIPK